MENDFGWGDLETIFTSDEVTSENNCREWQKIAIHVNPYSI